MSKSVPVNERFEIAAIAFRRVTGRWPPGKDAPIGEHFDRDESTAAWSEWMKQHADVIDAVCHVTYERAREESSDVLSLLQQENARLTEQAWQLAFMLNRAVGELNAIRARDGVPHTSKGQPYGVTYEYFSSIIDDSFTALEAHGTPHVPWDLKRPESVSPQPVQGGGE